MSSSGSGQRFADYFVVTGLDTVTGLEPDQLTGDSLHISPLERSYKAKVLLHFPANVEWNPFDKDAVRMLSHPQGLTFKKKTEYHESTFHSFLITREDGSRVYGCALTFFEVVKDSQICTAMQTLQTMHEAELDIVESRSRSRSPVSFTTSPFYASESTISSEHLDRSSETIITNRKTFDVKKDTLLVSKSICIIMPLPFISAGKACLEQIYDAALNEEKILFPLESYIYNLLFEVPLPPPGKTMRFTCNELNITCQRPGTNELPLFDYSFKELMSLLGVENLVQLFTCALLEQQILLISNHFHKLMLVAESITSILFPFVWQHVYVPILPAALSHFLDAPVPFLMGIYQASEEDKKHLSLPSEASLCLVDIDKCTVTIPEDLPDFPDKKELMDELNETAKRFNVPMPQECESQPGSGLNSLENSLEIPQNNSFTSTANGSSDYESGSNTVSPKDSPKESPKGSPRGSPRSGSPILEAKKLKKPATKSHRMKARKSKLEPRVAKSKSSTSLDMSKKQRLQAIAAIAERTGIIAPISNVASGLEKSVSDTQLQQYNEGEGEFILGDEAKEISRKQQHENEFNTAVREIFANRFTQLLSEYESFVIQPQQGLEDWTSNREQMQNFDKASFLSDQPHQFLPFLSPFTETQMFASFIDMKIMGNWEEPDPRLAVFDQRIYNLKTRLGVSRSPSYEKCMTLKKAVQVLVRRSNSVDHMATLPQKLTVGEKKVAENGIGLFMSLDKEVLSDGPNTKSGHQSKVRWRRRSRQQQQSEHIYLNTTQDGKKMRDKLASQLKRYMQETKAQSSQLGDLALESAHSGFVQKLLLECRQRTKKILVQKMGQEAVDLGHSDANVSGVEENTLIASLCDLLERVWSHGLQTRQGKSALWSHLLAFQLDCEEPEETSYSLDTNSISPAAVSRGTDKDHGHLRRRVTSPDLTNMMQSIQLSQQQSSISSILTDMSHVQGMGEIRTDVGHARAWIRLALEKKMLSKHLKEVLSHTKLLRERYKEYAFVRTDEEKEQCLYHLLSLTAVDFFCFTNGFLNTAITYKAVIKTGKQLGGSTTTAQSWMTLAGSITDTGVMSIPKNENEFRFQHANLGVLTTLRIGHDNTGYSPGWFIEQVIIKNEVTSHIYRFSCGRWLAKNMDDGSTERLLVAELMRPKGTVEVSFAAVFLDVTQRSPDIQNTAAKETIRFSDANLAEVCRLSPQRRSPVLSRKNREKKRIPEVQERVADAVNNIVKHFYKPEKERGNLTYLLCGDGGLCQALEQVFQCGFRSSRLFRNNFFIWDILEKAQQYLSSEENDSTESHVRRAGKAFCSMVTRINNASHTIGKDGKFQSFVCLGARDHYLHRWFELLSTCPATTNMYDTPSFFRDSGLIQFVVELLQALDEFNITLEASLLKGIETR